ncbi:MAG: peptide transporter, partial [Planctomycetota bacterium]|nr:peptide transporter [Planctomycetota bacterium]
VAGAMIGGSALLPGGPFGQLIWRQYLVTADAVKDAGLYGKFPSWFAPPPDSSAIVERTFLHSDWLIPIALLVFMTVIGFVKTWTLGYALFRLTSDVEKLPFPMAPVGAQGVLALAEGEKEEKSWRWTVFSVGTVLGLVFGAISVAVPTLSSAFLAKPIYLLPIPWFELTTVTEGILPATPTGIILDLGLILGGFVMPFWAVIGTSLAVLITLVLNPLLYHWGVLTQWQPGMDTIATQISNSVDFYFSAGLGVAFGVAVVSIYQTVRQIRASLRDLAARREREGGAASLWTTPPGRGDWSLRLCLVGYVVAAAAVVSLSAYLVPAFRAPFTLIWLILFAFVYTPLTSY